MTLSWTNVGDNNSDYVVQRDAFIKERENAELYNGSVPSVGITDDGTGRLVTGYGYDLNSKTAAQLQADLSAVGVAQSSIDVVTRWKNGQATAADVRAERISISSSSANILYNKYVDSYEAKVNSKFGDGSVPLSWERISFVSLAYNNSSLIGNPLSPRRGQGLFIGPTTLKTRRCWRSFRRFLTLSRTRLS
jgi:hypothetical protein